jgi:hypothetical protein
MRADMHARARARAQPLENSDRTLILEKNETARAGSRKTASYASLSIAAASSKSFALMPPTSWVARSTTTLL